MVESKSRAAIPPYAEFGRIVSERLDRARLKNPEAAKAVGVTPEMIRRYRDGLVMPRDDKLERLAKLIGVPAAELRYGGKSRSKAPAMPLARLSADEQALLDEYRLLPGYAQKAVRARIIELLEEFAPPSKRNPFGKGGTQ